MSQNNKNKYWITGIILTILTFLVSKDIINIEIGDEKLRLDIKAFVLSIITSLNYLIDSLIRYGYRTYLRIKLYFANKSRKNYLKNSIADETISDAKRNELKEEYNNLISEQIEIQKTEVSDIRNKLNELE